MTYEEIYSRFCNILSDLIEYLTEDTIVSILDRTLDGMEPIENTVEYDFSNPLSLSSDYLPDKPLIIEYPISDTSPSYLIPNQDYEIYYYNGYKVRFLTITDTNEKVRIHYYIKPTYSMLNSDQLDAFFYLAQANAYQVVANKSLTSSESTIEADSVNYKGKAEIAHQMYKDMMSMYKDKITKPSSSDIKFRSYGYIFWSSR